MARGARARAARRPRAAPSAPALGRAAAARRARAGARALTGRAPPRRAARRARREAPARAPDRAEVDPARDRDHVRLRDARPGGGADDVRPPRGDGERQGRAARGRRATSTSTRRPHSSPTSSASRTSCGPAWSRAAAWTSAASCSTRSRASARAGVVRLTIRPERVRIEPPATAGENRVPATIERFVYLGSTTQVFVALPGGDRVQALVANSGDVDEYDVGAAVTAHLPADALRILADDEAGPYDRRHRRRRRASPGSQPRATSPAAAPTSSCSRRATGSEAASSRSRVDDGRPVQLGGEMIGQAHTAYLGLVEELGLTLDSTYTSVAGATTYDLVDGRPPLRGRLPVRDAGGARRLRARRAAVRRARGDRRSRRSLVAPRRVAPRRRVRGPRWLRSVDALPDDACARSRPARWRSPRARASGRRCSRSCARPRRWATTASTRTTSGSRCRSPRAPPRSRCAWRGARRPRSGSARWSRRSRCPPRGCRVTLDDGRGGARGGGRLRAAGQRPPRDRDRGRRRPSGSRRCARSARRSRRRSSTVYDRSVWADLGANGLSEGEHLLASTWPQRDGVLSGLVPPERVAWLAATADEHRLACSVRGARAHVRAGRGAARAARSCGSGRPIRSRAATRRTGGRATCCASGRCTARTIRRSTSAGRTSGWPATWRAPSARGAPPPRRH